MNIDNAAKPHTVLLISSDDAYERLCHEADFHTFCRSLKHPRELLALHDQQEGAQGGCFFIAADMLDSQSPKWRDIPQTDWETILGSIGDWVICHLVIFKRPSGMRNENQTDVNNAAGSSALDSSADAFADQFRLYADLRKKIRDITCTREFHADYVLILVCENDLTSDEHDALRALAEGSDALYDAVYCMTPLLEPLNENQLIHAHSVWPTAVTNLLMVLLHRLPLEKGIFSWRCATLTIHLPVKQARSFYRRIVQEIEERVFHDEESSADLLSSTLQEINASDAGVPQKGNLEDMWRPYVDRQPVSAMFTEAVRKKWWSYVHTHPGCMALLETNPQPAKVALVDSVHPLQDFLETCVIEDRLRNRSSAGYMIRNIVLSLLVLLIALVLTQVGVFLDLFLRPYWPVYVYDHAPHIVWLLLTWMVTLTGFVVGICGAAALVTDVFRSRYHRQSQARARLTEASERRRFLQLVVSKESLAIRKQQLAHAWIAQQLQQLSSVYEAIKQVLREEYDRVTTNLHLLHDNQTQRCDEKNDHDVIDWERRQYEKATVFPYEVSAAVFDDCVGKASTSIQRLQEDSAQILRDLWRTCWKECDPDYFGRVDWDVWNNYMSRWMQQLVHNAQRNVLSLVVQSDDVKNTCAWSNVGHQFLYSRYFAGMSCCMSGSSWSVGKIGTMRVFLMGCVNGEFITKALGTADNEVMELIDLTGLLGSHVMVGMLFQQTPLLPKAVPSVSSG